MLCVRRNCAYSKPAYLFILANYQTVSYKKMANQFLYISYSFLLILDRGPPLTLAMPYMVMKFIVKA